jgi:hypothetical protein
VSGPGRGAVWRVNDVDLDEGRGVWLLTGLVPAERAAVAAELAGRFPRSAHVDGEAFRRMIVRGAAAAGDRTSAEAVRQLHLRHALAAAVGDRFAGAGFEAVLQDVVVGGDLPALVAAVTARPLHVVVLAPARLDRTLHRDTPRLGLWIDPAKRPPSEIVTEVLARRTEARVG